MGATRRGSSGGRPGRLAAKLTCAAALSAFAIACAEKGAVANYNRDACRFASDSAYLFNGIKDYIGSADPFPQRFLYIPGTDSTPPDPGIEALQDKGPTFLYSAAPDQQKVVRTKLTTDGDYATLLVAYHGFKRTDAEHGVIRLSGTYVTGKSDGKTLPVTDYPMHCDGAGWHGPKPPAKPNAPPTQAGAGS